MQVEIKRALKRLRNAENSYRKRSWGSFMCGRGFGTNVANLPAVPSRSQHSKRPSKPPRPHRQLQLSAAASRSISAPRSLLCSKLEGRVGMKASAAEETEEEKYAREVYKKLCENEVNAPISVEETHSERRVHEDAQRNQRANARHPPRLAH